MSVGCLFGVYAAEQLRRVRCSRTRVLAFEPVAINPERDSGIFVPEQVLDFRHGRAFDQSARERMTQRMKFDPPQPGPLERMPEAILEYQRALHRYAV